MVTRISRVKRSKEDARSGYNRLSRWYDMLAGSSEKKYRDLGLEKLSACSGETILEIGFGTGHCLLALARAVGEAGRVIGLDISDEMLSISRARLAQKGLTARVDLHLGDAASMAFVESQSVDGVFMSFTLELFDTPEIPRVLAECKRVLKPNGRMVVVAMAKQNPPGLAVRIYEWFHEHFEAYADCRPIFPRQMLLDAGFVVQDAANLSMWGLPVEIVLAQK